MTRPMPKGERYVLTQQYRGRRQALAQAAHAHICFYEGHPGFAIDWQQQRRQSCRYGAEQGLAGTEVRAQCLCEEDFLADILWRMISGESALGTAEETP